jgi:hypothetical protein
MEEDTQAVLAQQVLLHLPLVDMLECKFVCRSWTAHVRKLMECDVTLTWSRPEMARKMAAAMDGDGPVVQRLHLSKQYTDMTRKGYWLRKCSLFESYFLLGFTKMDQDNEDRDKYWFCVLTRNNVHDVHYATEYVGTYGNHFYPGSRDSVVIWWYNLESDNSVRLDFRVIENLASPIETSYSTTLHKSDFLSPLVALNEIISGNNGLRSEIKMQFPGLDFHNSIFYPNSTPVSVADLRIFYYKNPPQEPTELWLYNSNTMQIEVKRSTHKSDWICNASNETQPVIELKNHRWVTLSIIRKM